MRTTMAIGVLLIVLGVAALFVRAFTYPTRERVLDAGGVRVDVDTRKTIEVPLVAGGLTLAAGVVLVVVATRKR